jgi:ferric-dicitrate binding protein FerR (iron transport regulator)
MDKEQALQIIEQALNGATLKGVYNLADVSQILMALQQLKSN